MDELGTSIPGALERFVERLRVDTIFGQPERQGDLTVIPVAEVRARLGYGYGSGTAPVVVTTDGAKTEAAETDGAEAAEAKPVTGSGSGGGAGGTGTVTPRGYIQLRPDGAKWVPIQDEGKTAIAGIALAGWIVFWVTYTVRAVAKAVAAGRAHSIG